VTGALVATASSAAGSDDMLVLAVPPFSRHLAGKISRAP
jgi:hypothetical protein